jgi:Kef-type K+ transport system membrane component KefB
LHLDLLDLVGVLAAAWGGARASQRLGLPPVVGEILAGLLLGPPLLGLIGSSPSVDVLAQVGILLLMFYFGMETDPVELRRASWSGFLVAVGGFAVPFVAASWVVRAWGGSLAAAAFVGVAAGVTSLATKARVLVDLRLVDTRIAQVMMAGAMWTDVSSLVALGGLLAVSTGASRGGVWWPIAGILVLGLVAFLVGRIVLPRAGAWIMKRGPPSRPAALLLVLVFCLFMAAIAESTGLHGILGAFLAGLLLRERMFGRQLVVELRQAVHDTAIGFLAPVFFVTVAFDVDLGALTDAPGLVVALLLVASVGKVVGTALTYLPTGHGWREALVVGAGMNDRGAVEIVMAGVALREGLIGPTLFGALVLLAVTTTATAPVLLRVGARWLEARGELARAASPRAGTIVVGAGPDGIDVARRMAARGAVVIVDSNPLHVAAARAAGLDAVQGDALDPRVLDAVGAGDVAILVAATTNPSLDVLVARLARQTFGVPMVRVSAASATTDPAVVRHLDAELFSDEDPPRPA